MNKLRIELNKILKTIHPNVTIGGRSKSRVHYERATDDTPFPYIVYDLPQSYIADDQEILNLDINVWDNKTDTTDLETLASDIWNELNRYYYLDDNVQFSVYRQSRLTIQDDDGRIRRRTLIFNIKYYDRRVN